MPRFTRVAIVNRGEPAMRFIHAAREYAIEHNHPLTTIALATDADRHSLFAREADEVQFLGSATFLDEKENARKVRYLDYEALERALVASRAEAVWVGWGFVAEHAEFADMCQRLGIVFMGPNGDVMRKLGDKISSKRMAEQADVAVAPWSGGPVETVEEAAKQAERLGYPLMVKATAGGGGRGIRRVRSEAELADAFREARSEAHGAFGDPTVFLESMLTGAHHVEVQIIADSAGNTWALGVRDCSIQRRNQKVLEETPSPVLSPEQDRELQASAVRLGKLAGYQGAGTVEFLYDPKSEQFSFMEVNARLQVEHPVTEVTTGTDLVKLQIHVAQGGLLEGDAPKQTGHAIEVRLCAEDPDNGFMPAPGLLSYLRLPVGGGVRVDTGVEEGDRIPAEFDSMIAKIIASGKDRAEAMARLERALVESAVVVQGGTSNKGFLLGLLRREEVRGGREIDVSWLDGEVSRGLHMARGRGDIALCAAAIACYDAETAVSRERFYAHARRGRPQVKHPTGREVELEYDGNPYLLTVRKTGADQYQIRSESTVAKVEVDRVRESEWRLHVAGACHRILLIRQGATELVEVDGVPHRISLERGAVVRAPAPGIVVSLAVKEGDQVDVGDRLVVLEAMKTELAITARFPGRVGAIKVAANTQVDTGQLLMEVEQADEESAASGGERVTLSEIAEPPELRESGDAARHQLNELCRLLLGYDVDPSGLLRAVREHGTLVQESGETPDISELEYKALRIFVDVCTLLRPQSEEDAEFGGRSTKEYLYTYLRDPGARGEGLPAGFVDKLSTAVAHHGVVGLEPSAALEDALFRLFISHERLGSLSTLVLSVLERQLQDSGPARAEQFRPLLERVISVAQNRFQDVYDGALELRYRLFDQPQYELVRRQAYDRAEQDLERLPSVSGEERAAVMSALVECPQPLKCFLSRQMHAAASADERWAMLEVLTRRYYRMRTLENFERVEAGERLIASGEYEYDGARIRLLSTFASAGELPAAMANVVEQVAATPHEFDIVIDLYLWNEQPLEEESAARARLEKLLAETNFGRPIRRVVFATSGPQCGLGMAGVQHFTYRSPEGAAFAEDRIYRGVHPMMGKRLDLWRLENFDLERLPSAEDVYLLRAVARDNRKDERLVALAEVRDATPLRDEAGKVVAVPHLERMLFEGLAAIRREQAHRPARQRLHWNRVQLFVWPTLDLKTDELSAVASRLAPATEGAGLEKILVDARLPGPEAGAPERRLIVLSNPGGSGVDLRFRNTPEVPVATLSEYTQKVVRLRQRGMVYPYELVKLLAPAADRVAASSPQGEFIEHDLDGRGELVPVERPYGENQSNIVVGVTRSFTSKHPEGMSRVTLLGDPSRGMGALAEAECTRIIKAIDLAEKMKVPVEWFALSAGAKISMESGTENMDWIAWVLKRLVEFTQAGGEVNIIVCGINVGAQPYWNAEATMLMHTRGILIMLPTGAMVLTGKQALDYSGGVSAEDNEGIGGYERVMGPNGQAQYLAHDFQDAVRILYAHYDHTYVTPGERFPRKAVTKDPGGRDVCSFPHGHVEGASFATIGEVFSEEHNPGRKKPFDIRRVMHATIDQDHPPLERWFGMQNAETSVVWDAHIGGYPVCMLGLESRPVTRVGFVPADGPASWTGGTLFPMSSRKVARAINSASGNRPVVVLANLSGFDGSPESLRQLQLEYGAEIGRAVVNFDGPIVFLVISRYHGGAFVVFSNKLNDGMEVVALEGTHASVIGGAPAAAVVFAGEVKKRVRQDARVVELGERIKASSSGERSQLRAELEELTRQVESEVRGEVAEKFDRIHSVERAKKVGSVHDIIAPDRMRPYLIDAIERGMARCSG